MKFTYLLHCTYLFFIHELILIFLNSLWITNDTMYSTQIWLFRYQSAHFSGNLAWETIHVLCTNVLIPINWSGVFIKFLKEPWGNAVEVWVTSYSLHYLIWKYPKRTSANEEILRSVLLSKSSGLYEEIFMPAVEICCRS